MAIKYTCTLLKKNRDVFLCDAIYWVDTVARPRPIMLKILPIMLLSSAQKIAHYAQYYARKY